MCRKLYDPNDSDQLTMPGLTYGQAGAYQEAIEPLQAASRLDPESFEIWHNLGLSYFRLRNYHGAREPLETAVALRPDFFGSNALLGAVLYSLKDDAAAYRTPIMRTTSQLGSEKGALRETEAAKRLDN